MSKKIIILSSEACTPCKVLKNTLRKENIEFRNVDINDPKDLEEVKKLRSISGRRVVPQVFTEYDGSIEFLFNGLQAKGIRKLKE